MDSQMGFEAPEGGIQIVRSRMFRPTEVLDRQTQQYGDKIVAANRHFHGLA